MQRKSRGNNFSSSHSAFVCVCVCAKPLSENVAAGNECVVRHILDLRSRQTFMSDSRKPSSRKHTWSAVPCGSPLTRKGYGTANSLLHIFVSAMRPKCMQCGVKVVGDYRQCDSVEISHFRLMHGQG